MGTGDGRLPYALAREAPERLFVGIDANAAGLRERSGRAERAGANVVYVRAAVEDLPPELAGYAAAGFSITSVRPMSSDQLARWPSTWARRLAHGRARPAVQIEARAFSA